VRLKEWRDIGRDYVRNYVNFKVGENQFLLV